MTKGLGAMAQLTLSGLEIALKHEKLGRLDVLRATMF